MSADDDDEDEDEETSARAAFRQLLYSRSRRLLQQIHLGKQLIDGDDLTSTTCTKEDGYCLYRLRRGATVFTRVYRPTKCDFSLGRAVFLACIYLLRTKTTYFVVVQDRKKDGGWNMEFPVEFAMTEKTHRMVLSTYKYNSPCLLVRDLTRKIQPILWHYAGIALAMEKLTTPSLGEILSVHNVNTVSNAMSLQEVHNRIDNHFSMDSDVIVHLYTLHELQERRIRFNLDARRIIDRLTLDANGYVVFY